MTWIDALLLVAVALNTLAFVLHERTRRRLRADRERLERLRDLLGRLVVFVGWLSTEHSGAPLQVRDAARRALGDDVDVESGVSAPPSDRVH